MKLFLIILLPIVLLFLLFCFIASYIMVNRMLNPNFKTRTERNETNRTDGFLVGVENYDRTAISFKMSDGYIINGDISLNDPKRIIVFAHGHGSNREGSIKFTKIFYDMGYSLLLYDHRGHGDNARTHLTMGVQESKDLAEIVDFLHEKYGNDVEIGLFGYSMGGATVCLASRYLQNKVKFIVSDCAYSSLAFECNNQCIVHKIPLIPTILFMQLFFKIKYNLSFKNCDVKKAIESNLLPICFFHGGKDRTVFASNSKRLFEASGSKIKKYNYFENAGHSRCIEIDPGLYKQKLQAFLKEIGE